MTGALSEHYARALADAVFHAGDVQPEQAVDQMRSAEAAISGSHDLQVALLSPAVNNARKMSIVRKISDELQLHRTVRNFLSVLVRHRRIHEIKAMRQSFEQVVDERLGWIRAEIASARELSAEERQQVEQALGTKLGKFIRAAYSVDAELLSGIRARVAAREYDATLRGQLESLRQRLHASV